MWMTVSRKGPERVAKKFHSLRGAINQEPALFRAVPNMEEGKLTLLFQTFSDGMKGHRCILITQSGRCVSFVKMLNRQMSVLAYPKFLSIRVTWTLVD